MTARQDLLLAVGVRPPTFPLQSTSPMCPAPSWVLVVLTASLSMVGAGTEAMAREAHWIEGEQSRSSTFNRHSWYSNTGIRKDLLSPGVAGKSNGGWLAHYTDSGVETASAAWEFTISEPGAYTCWIRLNPFSNSNGGANYTYRFDGGPFAPVDLTRFLDRVDLVDPGIDIRFIGWGVVATPDLSQGRHTLTVRLARRPGEAENHGAVDVIALVNFPWAPAGVVPPDPTPPEPQPNEWFTLQPGPDPFSPDSIIDMSGLLDRPAGIHGPLGRDGSGFRFADGVPVKFWGVNAAMMRTDQTSLEQARFLAKYGVNMVRLHPVEAELGVLTRDPATRDRMLHAPSLDLLDRWFATLKAQGLYSTWSLFYPHILTPDDGYPADLYAELPTQGPGKSGSGLVAFMPELQEAEWIWERTLLEHLNPYTLLRYKDDPALAILELHNEDSVFWHAPLNDLAAGNLPRHLAVLQRRWRDWLVRRYESDAALAAAWGPGLRAGDSLNNDRLPIYGAWEMEADGPTTRKFEERRRMGDFIRFLAETQRAYYERRRQQLWDLGFKGLMISTAWQAGGAAADAANLWTDDAADVIDRHEYFGGGAGGHSITAGRVDNASHLDLPGRGILSAGLFQVEDKPFVLTEWTQKPPNQWKTESSPLLAFYGMGLQGWDASYHFASSRTYMGDGWPGLRSYVTETPHYLGQFPALAFAIHHRHLREGPAVSVRRRSLDQVFAGIDGFTQDLPGGGFDDPSDRAGNVNTPVEVLAIGRVSAKVGDGLPLAHAIDWSPYWDPLGKTVVSATGELNWDYGRRVVTVRSPKTQAIIGFAGGETYVLPAVRADITTPFVVLLFTPLDNRELAVSEHILITAMARDQQSGAVYNDSGTQLLQLGSAPLLLEPVQATLTFEGPPITAVKPVDPYGVPVDRVIDAPGNRFQIDGRFAAYYYEIRRTPPPLTLRIERQGDRCVLSWQTQPGVGLFEADRIDGPWRESSSVPTGSVSSTVALQPAAAARFFRLSLH